MFKYAGRVWQLLQMPSVLALVCWSNARFHPRFGGQATPRLARVFLFQPPLGLLSCSSSRSVTIVLVFLAFRWWKQRLPLPFHGERLRIQVHRPAFRMEPSCTLFLLRVCLLQSGGVRPDIHFKLLNPQRQSQPLVLCTEVVKARAFVWSLNSPSNYAAEVIRHRCCGFNRKNEKPRAGRHHSGYFRRSYGPATLARPEGCRIISEIGRAQCRHLRYDRKCNHAPARASRIFWNNRNIKSIDRISASHPGAIHSDVAYHETRFFLEFVDQYP